MAIDFETLFWKSYGAAWPNPRCDIDASAAATVLRDAFTAELADQRADEGELATIAWMDGAHRSAKGVREAIADRDRTIAERDAEIGRLKTEAVELFQKCLDRGVLSIDDLIVGTKAEKIARARQALGDRRHD